MMWADRQGISKLMTAVKGKHEQKKIELLSMRHDDVCARDLW